MPLTFTELNTLLTPTEGTLRVTASQLGAGPMADLLTNWFTDGVLALAAANASPDSSAGTVTVTGTVAAGTFLGIGHATLSSGVFTLAGDGSLAARLAIAVGDADWGLSASFPVLAKSVCDSLSYANPVFSLDSADTQPLPADVRTEFGFPADDPGAGHLLPGLSFTASVSPASSLASKITGLVATPLDLTGPIRVYSPPPASGSGSAAAPYPEFLLAPAAGIAPRPVEIDGQQFTITAQLACLLTATATTGTGDGGGTAAPVTVNPVMALQTGWTGTGSLPPITLRGVVTGAAPDTVVLDTGAAPLAPIGTDEMPALLGGTDVSGLLTPGHDFPVFQDLVLHQVSLTLGLGPLSLREIAALLVLAAATGAPDPVWSILGGLLTMHQLAFDVEVARGSDGALHPTAAVAGSATLGQGPTVTLTATVSLPGLTVTAQLDATAPADLTALVKDQFGIALPLPTITSADVTVTGDVAAATWTIDTQVEETWTLLGSPPDGVSLQDIALHLAGASGKPTTGSLNADLEVGGVPLAADADYSTADGWTVHAALATGAQADLAAVLTALLAAAGLPVTASLPSVTLTTLSVDYQETKRELSAAAAFAATGATLLQQLGQALSLPEVPAIGLSAINGSLTETASGTAITFHLTATDWSIPLGPATLTVSGVALDVTHTPVGDTATVPDGSAPADGTNPAAVATTGTGDTPPAPAPAPASTTATITGTLAVAGASATVTATLPGALTITGSFPAVGLAQLVSTLSGNTLTLPAALGVTLPASTLQLTENAGEFQLAWHTATSPLGEIALQVQRLPQAGWGVAAGFALPANWKLSSLSSALSSLDGLTFTSAALVLASFAAPTFAFTDLTLPALSGGVVEGLTFGCSLALSGTLAGAGAMLGRPSVDVTAVIGPDPSTIKLSTALAGTVAIPPTTNLLLGDLALSITPDPLGVSLSGALTIPVGSQTLVATGRFSVTETAADFALDVTGSALSLAAPMGFRGVVLDEIGVEAGITFEPPGINLALAGAFHLAPQPAGSDRFAFAFTVEGEAVTPTLLSGHLDQLDLPTLFGACMLPTAVLPSVLTQISFSDLTLYWCDTEQPLPDGSTAQPGFGVSGSMLAFGWNAQVKLLMDFGSGVNGDASCDPVNLLNGAFTLTGTGTTGGPRALVDTTASPYLSVSLNAKLLDIIGENVQGTLSSSGLTFSLANQLGVLDTALAITAAPTGASLASSVNFDLDVTAGPLDIPGTGLTLGSIHVQAGFSGSITINISTAGFHATIDGGFIWQGQHWQLATVAVTETPTDVAGIAQAIAQAVQAQAQTLFGELLSDSSRYFTLVADGLVSGASDAGTLATSVYHLTAEETETLFQNLNLKVLGLIVYGDANGSMQVVRGTPDIGQGSGAVAWLAGDFTGSGKTEIAQPWNNNGQLGLIVYGDVNGSMQVVRGTPDIGQGSGAVAWLAGDFTGSGKTEIAQPWNNNGQLGLIVYGDVNGSMQVVRGTPDIGQGSGAVAWLAGDFTGSGKTEIAQPWNNNGQLGLIVYGDVNGSMQVVRGTPDIGQGSGAVAWLAGDFTGSGKTEIAQPWNNNGQLGLIVYGDVNGSMQVVRGTPDIGQGSGAVAWLAGDFTGSGKTEIAQPWNNNGQLGLIVYGDVNGSMQVVRGTPDIGQGSGAVAWLAGDFTGSGKTEIAQPWNNNGQLGLIVYGDVNGSMQVVRGTPDIGQGSGAVAWLTGDFTGSGKTEIAQPWSD